MRKGLTKLICVLMCISLGSGSMIAQPITSQVATYQMNDYYSNGKIAELNTETLQELHKALSVFTDKEDFPEVKEEIRKILPKALLIDKNDFSNIKDSSDFVINIISESPSIQFIDSYEEKLTPVYFEMRSFFNLSNDSNAIVIVEYDQEQGCFTMGLIEFCSICLAFVLVRLTQLSQGMTVKWKSDAGWALYETILQSIICLSCYSILTSDEYDVYIEPVPVCAMCYQNFSWVNNNWYCSTCNVWL